MIFLYIICPDKKTAIAMSTAALKARVAGCVNFFPIESMYRWKGKLERAREYALVVKTTRARAHAAETLIKKLHPYTAPCIARLKIAKINRLYAEWIQRETKWLKS